ncbi:MAG: hypothetical protein U0103_09645 [Candidatus Obscuribacterales bacterium]
MPGRKPNVTSLINKFKNLVNAKMPEAIQPQTETTDHEDNYFGTVVRDPYRWLESDDSKVENWIDKQNAYSDQYLSRILGASWLANKVRDFFPQENIRFPRRFGNYFFTGAGAQLTRSKSVNAVGSKVIEQDELPQAAVQSTFISRDGELVVFVLSDDSNWCQLQIKDLKSGTWSKVRSIAMRHVYVDWCLDGSGFYYCGQPKDEVGSKIFLHKLSSKYRRDKLIYHDVDPARQIHIALLSYGSHLGILTSKYPNRYSLMIKDLSKNDAPVTASRNSLMSSAYRPGIPRMSIFGPINLPKEVD